MPNLATTLKEEIRRLARKEIRVHVHPARRAAARHRREIAALKRLLKLQERKLALLAAKQEKQQAAGTPAPTEETEGARFSVRSVRAQRKRLKLTAKQFARLLGVSPQTIFNWEHGRARPAGPQFAALVAARSMGRRAAVECLAHSAPEKKAPRQAKRRGAKRR